MELQQSMTYMQNWLSKELIESALHQQHKLAKWYYPNLEFALDKKKMDKEFNLKPYLLIIYILSKLDRKMRKLDDIAPA